MEVVRKVRIRYETPTNVFISQVVDIIGDEIPDPTCEMDSETYYFEDFLGTFSLKAHEIRSIERL